MERESYIKNYKNLREKNLENKNLKIISLKSKGYIKDLKRGRYLNRLYSKNSSIKIKFI